MLLRVRRCSSSFSLVPRQCLLPTPTACRAFGIGLGRRSVSGSSSCRPRDLLKRATDLATPLGISFATPQASYTTSTPIPHSRRQPSTTMATASGTSCDCDHSMAAAAAVTTAPVTPSSPGPISRVVRVGNKFRNPFGDFTDGRPGFFEFMRSWFHARDESGIPNQAVSSIVLLSPAPPNLGLSP